MPCTRPPQVVPPTELLVTVCFCLAYPQLFSDQMFLSIFDSFVKLINLEPWLCIVDYCYLAILLKNCFDFFFFDSAQPILFYIYFCLSSVFCYLFCSAKCFWHFFVFFWDLPYFLPYCITVFLIIFIKTFSHSTSVLCCAFGSKLVSDRFTGCPSLDHFW